MLSLLEDHYAKKSRPEPYRQLPKVGEALPNLELLIFLLSLILLSLTRSFFQLTIFILCKKVDSDIRQDSSYSGVLS